jgi:hypothetical protein
VRKTVIDAAIVHSVDLEEIAKIEVTSEDPGFLLESAFVSGTGSGCRAAQRSGPTSCNLHQASGSLNSGGALEQQRRSGILAMAIQRRSSEMASWSQDSR